MKLKALIIVFLSIFSIFALAISADVDLAYSWLVEQPVTDTFSTSITALAISRADSSATQPYIDTIISQKDETEACWPSGNCNVQDTALALLVESKLGLGSENVSADDIIAWLTEEQSLASLSGTWNIQIVTGDVGTCTLTYTKQGGVESIPFDQGD